MGRRCSPEPEPSINDPPLAGKGGEQLQVRVGASPGPREKPTLSRPGQARPTETEGWTWQQGSPTSQASSSCPSSGTFQRLFMRYFLSRIWDFRRRLQRLAFSARLLSQGWARHCSALIRALRRRQCGEGRPVPGPLDPDMHSALEHTRFPAWVSLTSGPSR